MIKKTIRFKGWLAGWYLTALSTHLGHIDKIRYGRLTCAQKLTLLPA